MTNDMLWQAAIAGEGMRVWRESSAPSSIAAWVTTGGSPAMQQQVLMNSLMGWFHKHVKAVFMDENPDVPVIAPVAVLWGMGPILAGSLATSVWTAWLSRHTAMQRVTGWQPVGTDSTVISPFPDFILPLLPEGSGLTSQARTWRCVLSLFTLAAIAALLSSGWNNRQLLHRVSFDIWFRFTTDTRLNIDVVEFYDGQQGYEKGLTLPSVPPSGQHSQGVDAVWGMESHHSVVQKQVSTRDYNYRQATQDINAQVDVTRGDTTTYGEAYHYADNYLTPGIAYERHPAPESGAFYARIRHERYLNGQTQARAITSSPALSPGQVLKVTGGYEVAEVFARGVVITAMRSHARRDEDFCIHFDGIPDSADFSFRPEPCTRPVMAGTLPARVTSTTENDTYGHIDKDGRYRVNMLFDRDSWEIGFESLWVRQSRPYAGDTYGLHLPLLAGTEVAIGFEDGNPDRPYITGVLHDSAHGDHVTIRNYKRNVLRTPANNKIRLDDERGKEHIKVSTEYGGKSQLNLGHLVDAEKQPRGEGFELRTDSWGAIRAQKGIFISADGQAKAQGQVLDMAAVKRQLSDALSLAESLSNVLEAANIDSLDNRTQQHFLQQSVDTLQQPVIVAGAPSGIALSTPQHIQFSANQNQILTAGGNTEISALKRIALVAKKTLVVFAHEMGMKLVAAAGKIEMQAQTDGLDITAAKELTITSTENEILITAKKKITIQCGGSYLTIDPTKIEHGTNGDFKVKSADFDYAGPAKLDVPYPKFTACESMASDASSRGDATIPLS
ncbi:TPA: type VI secretion system tip protein VgrG [Enterobacter kobei]|nr:type VI secretion system tip protein VgrG [Enterobacter kobei]HBO1178388.1 type VI secretion system tip protein VgrG [Enterobacter kobei]HBO1183339.1 type VI secretion system tip protein VgrG [Enterobacter kobei]HBO2010313.1 type VI secretion system tip protein VgrG [Enterobacter kobei]HBO2417909.1 type VI secretion system tip protein VgrG [Enterobacter kobei]